MGSTHQRVHISSNILEIIKDYKDFLEVSINDDEDKIVKHMVLNLYTVYNILVAKKADRNKIRQLKSFLMKLDDTLKL